jgi:ABC-type arginine transport system ATPase subunit
MEKYSHNFVNYLQDTWVPWLPLAEFAAENLISEKTNCSMCFDNYGFPSQLTSDKDAIEDPMTICKLNTQQMALQIEQPCSKLRHNTGNVTPGLLAK